MKLFHLDLNDASRLDIAPSAATIGFFDGVHRGHRYLIESVMAHAGKDGTGQSTVITFDGHPRIVLHKDYRPRLLTTAGEKVERLSRTGVDNCVVLHFDEAMASLSAREFMKTVLHDRLNVRTLVTGYDNRFGRNRTKGFDDYVAYGRETGIDVVRADAFTLNGVRVSLVGDTLVPVGRRGQHGRDVPGLRLPADGPCGGRLPRRPPHGFPHSQHRA